jgi:hypothetical protein
LLLLPALCRVRLSAVAVSGADKEAFPAVDSAPWRQLGSHWQSHHSDSRWEAVCS